MPIPEEIRKQIYDFAVSYGYIDEPQETVLQTLIAGTIAQLKGSGVPVPTEADAVNPEYIMAVGILAAYRYSRRTPTATNMGANESDEGYKTMLRGWVWRLRNGA